MLATICREGVLDNIFGINERKDSERNSDRDDQVSDEEDKLIKYHPEDKDTSD